MDIRESIITAFKECLEESGQKLNGEISGDMELLKSGLDSLGFAILVTKLEQELGYDPFTLMEEAVYPRTFDEFVAIYEKYKSHKRG